MTAPREPTVGEPLSLSANAVPAGLPPAGFPIFTPPQNPNPGYGHSVKPRVHATSFGDGYAQRIAAGLNTQRRMLTLTWGPVRPDVADAIEDFLKARNGVEPFWYTTPLDAARNRPPVQYVCPSWQRTAIDIMSERLSAEFEEDFALNPPPWGNGYANSVVVRSIAGKTGDVVLAPEDVAVTTARIVSAPYTVLASDRHKLLVLNAGAALAFDGALLPIGFKVEAVNNLAQALAFTLSGFTSNTPRSPINATAIMANGTGSFLVTTITGNDKYLSFSGDVA